MYVYRRTIFSSLAVSAVLACSSAVAQQTGETSVPSAAAPAQESQGDSAQAGALETIIVTATRRTTSIQETPLSISAVTAAQLQDMGVTDPTQLSRVLPNVYATEGYGSGNVRFAIRGMSNSDYSTAAVSPVAVYVDDVYEVYTFGVGTQLFDLERVEVQRGPQGTLFGMNTTGGAVRYMSAAPAKRTEARVAVGGGGGEYGHYAIEAMLNTPLAGDTLYGRLSFRTTGKNTHVLNEYNGQRYGQETSYAGRGQLLWTPDDSTSIRLKIAGIRQSGDGPIWHGYNIGPVCDMGLDVYFKCVNGQPTSPVMDSDRTSSELRPRQNFSNFGATLSVERNFADGYAFTSVSAAERVRYHLRTNDDGMDGDFFHTIQQFHAWQASQEFRLTTPVDRMVSGVMGLFANVHSISQQNTTGSTEFGPPFDYMQVYPMTEDTKSFAAYGSLTLRPTSRLSLVMGLRGSSERKKIDLRGIDLNSGIFAFSNYGSSTPGTINESLLLSMDPLNPPFPVILADCESAPSGMCDAVFAQNETHTWRDLSWDATADYKVTNNAMAYVRAAKGFRSGGYNTFAGTPNLIATVNPETVIDYEGGIKSGWLNDRLRINASVFYYQYKNQQVQSTDGSTAGSRLSNAGESRIKGIELEIDGAVTAGLRLQATMGYTSAKYKKYNTLLNGLPISLAGNTLPYAPEWTGSAVASYTRNLGQGYVMTAETDWSYQSTIYFDPFDLPYTSSGGSTILGNARLTLELPWSREHRYRASAYVKNLNNRKYSSWAYFVEGVNAVHSYGERRIIGLQLEGSF